MSARTQTNPVKSPQKFPARPETTASAAQVKTPVANSSPPAPATGSGETNPLSSPEAVQPTTERFPAKEEQEGVLTFYAPLAKSVMVAGDFNSWHPEATPLAATGFGEWTVKLSLRPGNYQYRFWVDGAWADDPLARHSTPNPFGGRNALIVVGLDSRTEFL